jgi:hypothetical protein
MGFFCFVLFAFKKIRNKRRRRKTRNMCIQHVLLTEGSKIRKCGIGVVPPTVIMFRASFVKIGSAVEREQWHTPSQHGELISMLCFHVQQGNYALYIYIYIIIIMIIMFRED